MNPVVVASPAGYRARADVDRLDGARERAGGVSASESDGGYALSAVPYLPTPPLSHRTVFRPLRATLGLVIPVMRKDQKKSNRPNKAMQTIRLAVRLARPAMTATAFRAGGRAVVFGAHV